MITEYEVRVRRPWRLGVKKGDILKVNSRHKVQLVRGGFADLVENVDEPSAPDPVNAKPVTLTLKKRTTTAKKKAAGKAKDAD